MMERERVQKSTRERVGSAARSRSGKFAFSSTCPYSAKADFDIISSSRRSRHALFVSASSNASAKVRNVEERGNLKELGRTER